MNNAEEFITNMLNDSNIIYLIKRSNNIKWFWDNNGACLMTYCENDKTLTISFNRFWNYIRYKYSKLNNNEIENLFRKIIKTKYGLKNIKIINGLPY